MDAAALDWLCGTSLEVGLVFEILKYDQSEQTRWDRFVRESESPCLILERSYMEYHRDRFLDASFIVRHRESDEWLAIIPGNSDGQIWQSHGGLTFGGILFKPRLGLADCVELTEAFVGYLRSLGYLQAIFKGIPAYYSSELDDRFHYAMFRVGAVQFRSDTSFVLKMVSPRILQSRRVRGVKKAKASGLRVICSEDFDGFWRDVLIPNLNDRFRVSPVHSSDEICSLKRLFPKAIDLRIVVNQEEKLMGGAVFYRSKNVIHSQYISATELGKNLGALDLLFCDSIEFYKDDATYFSFGTANENSGQTLNDGLVAWKESFGCSVVAHHFYRIQFSP